jgi:hypothetical protein
MRHAGQADPAAINRVIESVVITRSLSLPGNDTTATEFPASLPWQALPVKSQELTRFCRLEFFQDTQHAVDTIPGRKKLFPGDIALIRF